MIHFGFYTATDRQPSTPAIPTDRMAYVYDIFLSYPHGLIEGWVIERFLPHFEFHVEAAVGYKPKIFFDRTGIATGDTWPARIKHALACSRCMVSLWTPSYFQSVWCMNESRTMMEREKRYKFRTSDNPCGLVLPINVSDGDNFPPFARRIQYLDCRDYMILGAGFEKTERFVDFQDLLRTWSPTVAQAIQRAPMWRKEWRNSRIIKSPKFTVPRFKMPSLAG